MINSNQPNSYQNPQNQQPQSTSPFPFSGAQPFNANQKYSYRMQNQEHDPRDRWNDFEQKRLDESRQYFGKDYTPYEAPSMWSHIGKQDPSHAFGDLWDGFKEFAPYIGTGIGAIFGKPEIGQGIGSFMKKLPDAGFHHGENTHNYSGGGRVDGIYSLLAQLLDR